MTTYGLAHNHHNRVFKPSLTFSTPPNATSYPHACIQMQVPGISSLHVYIQPEAVGLWVNLIRLCRVIQLLEHVAWANAPPFVLDADVGRRMVMGLEEVRRV